MTGTVSSNEKNNPLDFLEEIVVDNSWPHNRVNENTLYVEIGGQGCDFFLSLAWSQDSNLLQYTFTYNMKIRDDSYDSLCNLINIINRQLCFGHFELWMEDGWIIFRNSIFAKYEKDSLQDQISQIFSLSISECEKYYPAFQFVLFEDINPAKALYLSTFDTIGRA